ncbi:MAG: hypothetical protein ABIM88_07505, partial [candidate division WOR-3 bacterium]
MARCIYKGCEFDAWDKDPDGLCIYHSRREDKKEEFWKAFWKDLREGKFDQGLMWLENGEWKEDIRHIFY